MEVDKEILNYGLNLSMEFGENWLADVSERLKDIFPELTQAESNNYNTLFRKVNTYGHDFVRENPIKKGKGIQFVDFPKFEDFMKLKYSWINEANLRKLYSQSCYYVWK